MRIWRIRKCGAPLPEAAAAVTLDRLLGIVVNHLCLLATLPWLLTVVTDPTVRTGLIILALAGLGGIAVTLLLGYLRGQVGLTKKLPARLQAGWLLPLLLEISTVGRHFLNPRWALFKAGLLSILIAVANSLIFFTLLYGWQVDFGTALGCALLVPGILEIAMLPISIAGWGVREGVVVFVFGKLGVSAAVAFGTSIIFALILLILGLIGGLLWLFDSQIGDLRSIESQEGAIRDYPSPPERR